MSAPTFRRRVLPEPCTLHIDVDVSGVALLVSQATQRISPLTIVLAAATVVRHLPLDRSEHFLDVSHNAIVGTMGKKKVLVSYGVDIDAVAGLHS